MGGCRLDSPSSGYRPTTTSCKKCSIQFGEFLGFHGHNSMELVTVVTGTKYSCLEHYSHFLNLYFFKEPEVELTLLELASVCCLTSLRITERLIVIQ